jgi:MFS transporter, DHA2 family, multidrug resistance protein
MNRCWTKKHEYRRPDSTSRAFRYGDADGLPPGRRHWAAAAIGISACLSIIDGSLLNVALPTIARDFSVSPAESILVVNAYQLTVSVGLLPLAALGSVIGYRRLNQGGLVLFLVATIGCAAAPSFFLLTCARAFQGLGAAAIMSVSTALIRQTYPARMLGRGIGFNTMTVAASSAAGPALAGLILSVASWHWLFVLSVPLGLAALAIGARTLPEPVRSAGKCDWMSAVLTVWSMGAFLTSVNAGSHDLAPWAIYAAFTLALAGGMLLVRRERRSANPTFPLDLLRKPVIALSVSTSMCSFISQMLTLVSLPFLLSGAGLSASEIGFAVMSWPLAIALIAPIAGRLADRWPAGILGGLGLLLTSSAMLLLDVLPAPTRVIDVMWRMGLCGAGTIIFQAPNIRLIVRSAPVHRSAAAGGLVATVRVTGQTIGAALAALVFRMAPAGDGHPMRIAAAFVGAAALLSFSRMLLVVE